MNVINVSITVGVKGHHLKLTDQLVTSKQKVFKALLKGQIQDKHKNINTNLSKDQNKKIKNQKWHIRKSNTVSIIASSNYNNMTKLRQNIFIS